MAGRGCPKATFAPEKRGHAGECARDLNPVADRCGLLVPLCPVVSRSPGRLKPAPVKAVPLVPFVPLKMQGGYPGAVVF